MAYPSVVLDAITSKRCRKCDRRFGPAQLVSINIHLIVDPKEQTGLRYLLSLICPCGNQGFVEMQRLSRHDLEDVINEMRLRGNTPLARRAADQMHIRGTALVQRDTPRPSNRTAPDHPFTDEEVAELLEELDWFDQEIGSAALASALYDLFKLYKPPPYEDESGRSTSSDG